MQTVPAVPLISTIRERCRVCYTCVRECTAKAIRIFGGQAEVLTERCIGCGNCVRVCSQRAKRVREEVDSVLRLLASGERVAAILAPSFPADFPDYSPETLVGVLRECGFTLVCEVGFGADLVAAEYKALVDRGQGHDRYIATCCPAIVTYVERYHPALVDNLAPIVSPMIATSRTLRAIYGGPPGDPLRIVFIGPCIAKKAEGAVVDPGTDIDAVLTFVELRTLFSRKGVDDGAVASSTFDPPLSGLGSLFPLSRGMLQVADIREDLLTGQIVATTGARGFIEVLREFEQGAMDVELLEILSCNGCIMGPGMATHAPQFTRRTAVSRYVREHASSDPLRGLSTEQYAALDGLDLCRSFCVDDRRAPVPQEAEIRELLCRMGKRRTEDELNCGSCGYDTCREHARAIRTGLAESEMCLPYTIDQLKRAIHQLADTQEALMHSERLASMGQLAAGIAHEVNNPLGVVLMYAHLLLDEHGADSRFNADLTMIAEQADRCKRIVAGLLDFARQNKVIHEPTPIRLLIDRTLNATPPPTGVEVSVHEETPHVTAEIDRDQITQVLINLVSNSYQAMPNGGCLTLSTAATAERVILRVADTGSGISKENMKRIFQPFFTTKAHGKGTGLGLPVTYGIVKMHRGEIKVESNADPACGPTGTTFTVSFPRIAERD